MTLYMFFLKARVILSASQQQQQQPQLKEGKGTILIRPGSD